FAVHFDISSEISEPPKPNSAANTSRPAKVDGFTPKIAITMLIRASTARLVSRNRLRRLNMGRISGQVASAPRCCSIMVAGGENQVRAPRPGARAGPFAQDRSAPVHAHPHAPLRPLRALAHRPAARRLAGGGAGQLADGTAHRRPMAGADRGPGP